MLTQREKLTAQRLPVYQGPSPAPQQGPSLRIPTQGLMGTRQELPAATRPAPGPDIWNPGSYQGGSQAPPVAKPQARDILGLLLGLPRALTIPGIVANVFRPTPAGQGSTLQEQGIDPQAMAEASNRRIAAAKLAAEEANKRPQAQKLSPGARSFDNAFAKARAEGLSEFTWRGKRYNTRYAGE
jgi:hypothetical protein